MRSAHLLSEPPAVHLAPMPVDAPPVGQARARRLRLLQLREQSLRSGANVDVDAVASAIVRRLEFTAQVVDRVTEEARAEGLLSRRREPV
jgi:hypothetical protein